MIIIIGHGYTQAHKPQKLYSVFRQVNNLAIIPSRYVGTGNTLCRHEDDAVTCICKYAHYIPTYRDVSRSQRQQERTEKSGGNWGYSQTISYLD